VVEYTPLSAAPAVNPEMGGVVVEEKLCGMLMQVCGQGETSIAD